MIKTYKLKATLIIILFQVVFIFCFKFFLSSSQASPKDIIESHVKGNKNAPIKIVEYLDYKCSHCAKGTKYINEIMGKYPDKIFLEMRFFPLNISKTLAILARYAECASIQGKFWNFHNALLEKQNELRLKSDIQLALDPIINELGLDKKALEACVENEEVYDYIFDMKKEGRLKGVNRTPTYFVNDKMIVGVKNLQSELNTLLNNI